MWVHMVFETIIILIGLDNNIDAKISDQKTISIRRLQMIGVRKCSFDELYGKIAECLEKVSAYYTVK